MNIEEIFLLGILWAAMIWMAWFKHAYFIRITFLTAAIVAAIAWLIGI